jgi:hypothetical protein
MSGGQSPHGQRTFPSGSWHRGWDCCEFSRRSIQPVSRPSLERTTGESFRQDYGKRTEERVNEGLTPLQRHNLFVLALDPRLPIMRSSVRDIAAEEMRICAMLGRLFALYQFFGWISRPNSSCKRSTIGVGRLSWIVRSSGDWPVSAVMLSRFSRRTG